MRYLKWAMSNGKNKFTFPWSNFITNSLSLFLYPLKQKT